MERDFYTDEFEELIKVKSDQYRMYPSDKVWKGINRSLHSNKRKYWFGFALLITGLSYIGIDQLIVSPPSKQLIKPAESILSSSAEKQQAKIIPFDQVTPESLNNSQEIKPLTHTDLSENGSSIDETNSILVLQPATIVRVPDVSILSSNEEIIAPNPLYLSQEITSRNSLSIVGIEKLPTSFVIPVFPINQLEKQEKEDIQKVNWLEEYAVYNLTPRKPKRLNWQVSFSPTMNYRRLTGRKNANIQSSSRNIPIALNIEGDLDKLVNHKPALGFELGSYMLYSVTHNLSLKAGLQFNYSRYQIQAYSAATERATIALNSINGLSSSSISNYTQLRNFGGYAVQDLQNQYFQLSVPVGIELNILGNNKLQLGVAGTVQPTYLINRNTYLISSDYKNYTKEPSLVRRWNVNTSAETFVSYKTAGLKWQVGPQIRYQLLSSYTDNYPIKEYLIEYGVKIGVTKTIR